jgi:hypothetical protein
MVLYAYMLCLYILTSSRIPRYDLRRQTPAFLGGGCQNDLILLFVAFFELLGLVGAFFFIYEFIWLFVLSCRTLSEMPMMGMMRNARDGDD